MIVFYDGDSNIGSQNTPVLQPLETINVSMDYKLEHASEHIITIKIYTEDGETLLEKNSFTLIVNTQKTTPPVQKEEKKVFSLDFWLIGLIVTILVSALLISGKKIMKKHNEEKNKFSNMVQQKNSKSETKKTEKEGEENKEEKGSKKEGWE